MSLRINNFWGAVIQIRNYTRQFAEKMKKILPKMIAENDQDPSSPQPSRLARQELRALWLEDPSLGDTWDDAGLKDLCRYLLGARGLNIPDQWKWIVPTTELWKAPLYVQRTHLHRHAGLLKKAGS